MDPSYKIPGGGWLSTAGDMVRFGLALQAGTLLKPESFRTNLYMLLPHRTVVAVMINLEGEGLSLTELASEITNIVLGR
jgi:CubicO group peptidase (beta-lactamase class C family)